MGSIPASGGLTSFAAAITTATAARSTCFAGAALGHDVSIPDPPVEKEEVEAQYGRGPIQPADRRYELVIGAVRHDVYRETPRATPAAMLVLGGTLAGIKGMWRGKTLATSLDYWTL